MNQIVEVAPPGTDDEKVAKMKPSFKDRYGKKWKEVLYATLWKQHNNEEVVNEYIEKNGKLFPTPFDPLVTVHQDEDDGVRRMTGHMFLSTAAGIHGFNQDHALGGLHNRVDDDTYIRTTKPGVHIKLSQHNASEIENGVGEETISEMSKDAIAKYLKKAKGSVNSTTDNKTVNKRYAGIKNAEKKLKEDEEIIDETTKKKAISWNPPEVQAKAAKFKREQRMFDAGKREINRLKKQGK